MKTCKLTTCNNPIEAHMLQARLEAEGIACILSGEIMSGYPPMSGVTIFVNEDDYNLAKELIS